MRVVHTIDSLGEHHGGPARSITALCSALANAGVEVSIVTHDRRPGEPPAILPSPAVRMHLVPVGQSRLTDMWRSYYDFSRAVTREIAQPETVLHDHGLWLIANHSTSSAGRRARVPRIISPRGMLSPWALGVRRSKKQLAWKLYQGRNFTSADVIHVTSEQEALELRSIGVSQHLAVVPNGVEFPPEVLNHAPAARGERQALFLSRIHQKKGLFNLIAAWSRVRPQGWTLVIAGPDEGGHQAQVQEMVNQEGLGTSVRFIGPIPDREKWDLYRSSDLFVLPTFSENFGIVVAEALASGLPAITTKAAPWEGLERHRCGWWIDIGVEPLSAALQEATSLGAAQLRELGLRGREFVRQEFAWPRMAADMKAVYRWMLRGGEPPGCVLRSENKSLRDVRKVDLAASPRGSRTGQ